MFGFARLWIQISEDPQYCNGCFFRAYRQVCFVRLHKVNHPMPVKLPNEVAHSLDLFTHGYTQCAQSTQPRGISFYGPFDVGPFEDWSQPQGRVCGFPCCCKLLNCQSLSLHACWPHRHSAAQDGPTPLYPLFYNLPCFVDVLEDDGLTRSGRSGPHRVSHIICWNHLKLQEAEHITTP